MTYIPTVILALVLQGVPANPAVPPQQPPPRATIEGSVVKAGTSEPVSRAQVTITRVTNALSLPAAGARGANPAAALLIPSVVADSDGKFVIRDLAPGSYRIAAARNGYAKQEYGQRSSRSPGTVLNLQPGQNLKEIVFRLTPAGTVSGRVTDPTGEPLAGVTVSLLRPAYQANGKKSFQTATTARTNDLGEYRLYWITPGKYFLNASTSRGYMDTLLQSALSGATAQQRAEDNTGNVNASQAAMESVFGLNSNEVVEPGFAVTFYPGTADTTRAVPIEVQPAAELRGIDMALVRQQTFRIQGRVYDARTNQTPQTAVVQLMNRQDSGAFPKPANSYDPGTGAFEIREVPPGEYSVMAMAVNVTSAPGPGGLPAIGVAMVQVEVAGSDVQNIVATVRPGITVQGHVTLEGGAQLSSLTGFDRMRVRLTPAVEGAALPPLGQPPAITPEGNFTIADVSAGDYRVAMTATGPSVYLKSVRFGTTNALADPINVAPDSGASIEITLSAAAGQITGTLVDKDSKPVPTTQVVLIPERQRDRRDLFKPTVTDVNGRFTLNGVPPGDYRIFSWEEIEPFAYTDPDVLRQYEARATTVRVSENAKLTPEVKIIPLNQ